MYYLQSRYYDPQVGRFINADAFASTGQGILGNNMFSYCRNNPVSRIDVSGTADSIAYNDGELLSNDELDSRSGGGGGAIYNQSFKSFQSSGHSGQGTFMPTNYYVGKHAPNYYTPNSSYTNYSYNTFTQSYEMSTAYYDYAGRQALRIDWSNHGRADHGNPHIHYKIFDQYYPMGQKGVIH